MRTVPPALVQWTPPEDTISYTEALANDGPLQGLFTTDGAAFDGHTELIASAGRAVAAVGGLAAYGLLLLVQQAILPAEIFAVLMALRLAVSVSALCVDDAEVVRGLLR